MKIYDIILSSSAFEDLHTIFNFCKNNYSVNYALKIIAKIFKSIDSLSIFPNFNPIYFINKNTTLRKRVVNKRYIIIFKVKNSSINIYHIFDSRRNIKYSTLFKK